MKNPSKEFRSALVKLRKKFPMCYIEAWTPEDFVTETVTGKPAEVADWEDEKHCETVSGLESNFDANYGTNWDAVQSATDNWGKNSPDENPDHPANLAD